MRLSDPASSVVGISPIEDQELALISPVPPLFYDDRMKRSTRGILLLLCAAASVTAMPVYAADKSPDEWIGEANQALKTDPQDAKAFYNRGTGHYGNKDYEAAIEDLTMAVRLEPEAPDVFYNRGLSYRRLNKIDEAISDFTDAIRLYPDQASYYIERCNALIVRNDFRGAIADGSRAVVLSPEKPEAYFLRGLAFMLNGDLDEAFADASRALRLDADYRDAKRLLLETLHHRTRVTPKVHLTVPHGPVMGPKGIEMIGDSLANAGKKTLMRGEA